MRQAIGHLKLSWQGEATKLATRRIVLSLVHPPWGTRRYSGRATIVRIEGPRSNAALPEQGTGRASMSALPSRSADRICELTRPESSMNPWKLSVDGECVSRPESYARPALVRKRELFPYRPAIITESARCWTHRLRTGTKAGPTAGIGCFMGGLN